MTRNAAQIQRDTGSTATALVAHAVSVGTLRWGGDTAKAIARRFDIAEPTVRRALRGLMAKGVVTSAPDPASGDMVYSKAGGGL